MAKVFHKISSPSSSTGQGWTKTGRPNKVDDISDNSEALYDAIKEIVVVFQETQLKISSVLSVQADIQSRLDYWKIQLDRIFVPDVKIAPASIPPREIPCYADDAGKNPIEFVHIKQVPNTGLTGTHFDLPFSRIKIQLAPQSLRVLFGETRHFLDRFRRQYVLAIQVWQPIGFAIGREPEMESRDQFTFQTRR